MKLIDNIMHLTQAERQLFGTQYPELHTAELDVVPTFISLSERRRALLARAECVAAVAWGDTEQLFGEAALSKDHRRLAAVAAAVLAQEMFLQLGTPLETAAEVTYPVPAGKTA